MDDELKLGLLRDLAERDQAVGDMVVKNAIRTLLKVFPNALVTVILRHREDPDREFIATTDDLGELVKCIQDVIDGRVPYRVREDE